MVINIGESKIVQQLVHACVKVCIYICFTFQQKSGSGYTYVA
jgi:hypothetical protein